MQELITHPKRNHPRDRIVAGSESPDIVQQTTDRLQALNAALTLIEQASRDPMLQSKTERGERRKLRLAVYEEMLLLVGPDLVMARAFEGVEARINAGKAGPVVNGGPAEIARQETEAILGIVNGGL